MRITIKIALWCAMGWMFVKLLYHWILPDTTSLQPMILLNMLLLLAAISFGLFYHKKEEGYTEGNAMSDIKAAMTSGVPYALIVSIFSLIYYSYVNPEYNQHQIAEIETNILKQLNTPEGLAQARQQNEDFEVLSKDQIYRRMIQGPRTVYSPQTTFVLMLMGLVLLSTVYAILVTIIFRRVLFRKL